MEFIPGDAQSAAAAFDYGTTAGNGGALECGGIRRRFNNRRYIAGKSHINGRLTQ